MAKSLVEYAKENPSRHGKSCWVCELPEAEEINIGIRNGLYPTQIREWLINECGYNKDICSAAKLNCHKQRGHHEKKSS